MKYLNRISGPLLDRIDLQVEIYPVPFDSLSSTAPEETSDQIRARVIKAREIQAARFATEKGIHSNAQMNTRLLSVHAGLGQDSIRLLRDTMIRLDMSARAYDRILKVSRTIADLDYASMQPALSPAEAATRPILIHHLREALAYRNLDRASWGQTVNPLT